MCETPHPFALPSINGSDQSESEEEVDCRDDEDADSNEDQPKRKKQKKRFKKGINSYKQIYAIQISE